MKELQHFTLYSCFYFLKHFDFTSFSSDSSSLSELLLYLQKYDQLQTVTILFPFCWTFCNVLVLMVLTHREGGTGGSGRTGLGRGPEPDRPAEGAVQEGEEGEERSEE